MSSLQYINEEGAGQKHSDACHYSQCVVLGNIVKCSGQGGWDTEGNLDVNDWKGQIDLAFENVDRVLRAAGLRGWEDLSITTLTVSDVANDVRSTLSEAIKPTSSIIFSTSSTS
ncbi:hypothetical protein LTR27_008350 [Elasticomyces elasticus]|nr:hypothetical protein LTR27_008350 [Elasticomyces elasticus]